MRAAIYNGKKNISIVDLPSPVCGPDDVLLKTVYASICGTDAAVYQHGLGTGHKVTVGGEFGHEAVCRIAAVGKNAPVSRSASESTPIRCWSPETPAACTTTCQTDSRLRTQG